MAQAAAVLPPDGPTEILIGLMGWLEDAEGHPVGTKGVGKDTLAEMLAAHVGRNPDFLCSSMSFADSLKDAVSAYFNLPRSIYDTPAMKEQPLEKYPGWTYRRLLEVFGTEIGRAADPDMWVKLVSKKIKDKLDDMGGALKKFKTPVANALAAKFEMLPYPKHPHKLIQVTDVRFKNEYDMLRSIGAVIVCVKRRLPPGDTTYQPSAHASNQPNPEMVPDIIVENYGPLDALKSWIPDIWRAILKHSE